MARAKKGGLNLRAVSLVDKDEGPEADADEAGPRDLGDAGTDEATLDSIVEAVVFAAGEPITAAQIARAMGSRAAEVRASVTRLKDYYDESGRAFELVNISGGYQLLSRREYAPYLQKLKKQRDAKKFSDAGLEVLAIIAYNPGVTRAEIENIRGVTDCGPLLHGLAKRKLIRIAGRSTKLGAPLMYETTREFLEHFGMNSLKDLPKRTEFAPLNTPTSPPKTADDEAETETGDEVPAEEGEHAEAEAATGLETDESEHQAAEAVAEESAPAAEENASGE